MAEKESECPLLMMGGKEHVGCGTGRKALTDTALRRSKRHATITFDLIVPMSIFEVFDVTVCCQMFVVVLTYPDNR